MRQFSFPTNHKPILVVLQNQPLVFIGGAHSVCLSFHRDMDKSQGVKYA
ncbi:hypothetical protein Z948_3357 [Sulfitobacter donghicola DSW-25 = KCTC 12864 = JCM 14565]|nr:hypothetical protein Z948_3357 [Sulfitobacter donghicola DSW-25 = KCTC 12864 = JCM 14565]